MLTAATVLFTAIIFKEKKNQPSNKFSPTSHHNGERNKGAKKKTKSPSSKKTILNYTPKPGTEKCENPATQTT